tara:strand:- start:39 stop:428 length:390 start_codon:yes stop_codon:yes gene_type:complete
MNVYQTNNDGVFVGITTADQDPIDASNMLIPAGCVETAPPTTTDEQLARWDGTAWAVEDIPAPEADPDDEPVDPAVTARAERDGLIAATDWWALSDRTMTAEQTAYRQALRDITDQADFPTNITWPTKP